MVPDWLKGGALSFDTETTSADPMTARIVTAHAVEVNNAGAIERGTWFVNPGVPIPAEASAIHGITDDMVKDWSAPEDAIAAMFSLLSAAWVRGLPVIVMSAPYDMTVLSEEAKRIHLGGLIPGPCLDPLVIDRGCDQWRKGKRTLSALAAHHGVKQDGAHSAKGDALCAARVLWAQAKKYNAIRRLTLAQLHEWQRAKHYEWAAQFQTYLRKTNPEAVVDGSWPVRRA